MTTNETSKAVKELIAVGPEKAQVFYDPTTRTWEGHIQRFTTEWNDDYDRSEPYTVPTAPSIYHLSDEEAREYFRVVVEIHENRLQEAQDILNHVCELSGA